MSVHMKLLVLLSWLPCLMGSIVKPDQPYGYAPYVWVDVSTCNTQKGWCHGTSLGGFALTVDYADLTNDMCTHYCPGKIIANWRPFHHSVGDPAKNEAEGLLGAYVKKLDRYSCLTVPGGFRCSDRVVTNTPLNEISILLHAKPRNRDYYFSQDPMSDCEPDPQCAAFKLLRRTLHAPPEKRQWPEADDVLTIRNSPYACVLSYVGLGDSESIGVC